MALLVLLAAASAGAASLYLPGLSFRVLSTPHFRIYYHQGGEAQARRLANIAEAVRSELCARAQLPSPSVTHVVLANQDDDPNGWATPLPYPTVRLAAAWPTTSDLIGNTDDWLRSVFIHEYAHILQLERGRGWASVARALLGRSPIAFPNLFLPQFQIEGFATFWESRLTGGGRLKAGDARAVVVERARGAGAFPLDRANGGLVEWPGGNAQYLEGAWFYDYLASRFGEETVGRLSNDSAGWLPYLSAPAYRGVFGASLGRLWTDFQAQLVASAEAAPSAVQPTQLTDRGYWVSSPRFDATGEHVYYFLRDPDGFPAMYEVRVPPVSERVSAHGAAPPVPRPRVVTDRFGGRFLAVRQGLAFFDELELRGNVAWRSDLRLVDLATGRTERLSRDARLLEPDVSADGRWLACVRVTEAGTRALAFYRIERGEDGRRLLSPAQVKMPADDADATYGAPRWSPDGRLVAAERTHLGGASSIVVVDPNDGTVRVLADSARGRLATPAWTHDGRHVLFAWDRAGAGFQIYAADAAGGRLRQVTSVPGGATFPDVSPDGGLLVFAGIGPRGYDVFAVKLDPSTWSSAEVASNGDVPQSHVSTAAGGQASSTPVRASRYSPLPTLWPRAWTPLADTKDGDLRLGAGTAGLDVLGRHAYAASVLWRTAADNGSGVSSARPDWSASYVYDRWRPAFYLSGSESTSLLQIQQAAGRPAIPAALREQNLASGVALPFNRVRFAQTWQVEFNAGTNSLNANVATGAGAVYASARTRRHALRSAWAFNSAKQYGRSISAEDGVALAVTSEQVREGMGADGNADAFTGEVRGYWRPTASHGVLAGRAGYGASTGDARVRRRFYLGGSLPAGSLVNFGSDALRMLRGFDDSVTSGDHVASASIEWRQPLLRVERGWGTVPVLLRTVHAALFADAGETWTTGFSADKVRVALGLEGAADVVIGFGLPFSFTAGVAWTRDGSAGGRTGASAYFRMGPSF